MSFIAGSITGTISMDESPGVAAFKKIGKEAGVMKNTVEREFAAAAKAGQNGFKNSLKDIGSEFGKKSNLGQGLKLLAGGGAIGGLSMASNMFANYAADVSKMTDEFRRGGMGAGEMFGSMARGFPVLGGMVRGFDEIKMAVTGERVALDAQAESTKKVNEQIDAFYHKERIAVDTTKALHASIREYNQAAALAGHAEPFKSLIGKAYDANKVVDGFKKQFLEMSGKEGGFAFKKPENFSAALAKNTKDLQAAKAMRDGTVAAATMAHAKLGSADHLDLNNISKDKFGLTEFFSPNFKRMVDDAVQADKAVEGVTANLRSLEGERANLGKLSGGFDEMNKSIKNISTDGLKAGMKGMKDEFTTGFKNAFSLPMNLVKSAELLQRKAMDDGKALTQQVDPMAKFKEEHSQYQNLLDHGAINENTYGLAMRESFNSARDALLSMSPGPNNSRVAAEEVGGHTTVTASDQGDQAAKDTAKYSQDMLEVLKKIADKDPARVTTVTMN